MIISPHISTDFSLRLCLASDSLADLKAEIHKKTKLDMNQFKIEYYDLDFLEYLDVGEDLSHLRGSAKLKLVPSQGMNFSITSCALSCLSHLTPSLPPSEHFNNQFCRLLVLLICSSFRKRFIDTSSRCHNSVILVF